MGPGWRSRGVLQLARELGGIDVIFEGLAAADEDHGDLVIVGRDQGGIHGRHQIRAGQLELEVLSVGTREQLATLLRVTVASQIGSAVVLDDQLTQSDPARLQWFKNALRQAAATSQIVVVTCRPFDYLGAEELPGPASTFWDGPGVRAMDLKQVVKRCK